MRTIDYAAFDFFGYCFVMKVLYMQSYMCRTIHRTSLIPHHCEFDVSLTFVAEESLRAVKQDQQQLAN